MASPKLLRQCRQIAAVYRTKFKKRGIPHGTRTSQNTIRPHDLLVSVSAREPGKIPPRIPKNSHRHYQIITIEGEKRYTCGQHHTRLNPNWAPFQHLERYSLEQGLDDFEVRDFLEEYLQRPIICECDILIDRKELRKRDLARMFGLDFEGCDLMD